MKCRTFLIQKMRVSGWCWRGGLLKKKNVFFMMNILRFYSHVIKIRETKVHFLKKFFSYYFLEIKSLNFFSRINKIKFIILFCHIKSHWCNHEEFIFQLRSLRRHNLSLIYVAQFILSSYPSVITLFFITIHIICL